MTEDGVEQSFMQSVMENAIDALRARITCITEIGVLVRTGRIPVEALHGAVLALDNSDDRFWLSSEKGARLEDLAAFFEREYEVWLADQEASSGLSQRS